MEGVAKGFVGLAAFSFVAAIVVSFTGGEMGGITAEGFSRASSNLALLALCLYMGPKGGGTSA